MLLKSNIFLILLVAVLFEVQICTSEINWSDFPNGFMFGTGSSAIQVEGAVKEDGKGQSVWDTFSHTPGKILDFSNDDIGVDQYHRFKEDIQLMKDLRTNAYRFSISWPRIFPNGSGEINDAGVDHYNEFINALVAEGIEPFVTIYHWDLPQALEDKYNGWLSTEIIKDYGNFAETCFQKFGDRVKFWSTIARPYSITIQGYDYGIQAPGHCSILPPFFCRSGNSATEPYIVGHNILRSHATVADIYRKKYKNIQGGSIGTILATPWFVPATNAEKDIVATQRAKDFMLGWFLDPLIFGDYPCSMKSRVGSRLPKFSQAEAALLKGSLDFVGINHFTTYYVKDDSINITKRILKDALTDNGALFLSFNGTNFIGEITSSTWLYIVPEGIRSLMNYIKQKYGNIPIIITENGMSDVSTPFISIKYAYAYLNDVQRIRYHSSYLSSLLASIKDGCNVKGYFTWSLLDCWGWETGYSSRTGLYYVDYTDNLKRYPKKSAVWYKNFLKPTN
ncbi:PREDICTED: beta-glucosidase 40-like [Lupinus angustifolius]|uniref:beta-glucosidase 40-like n=1 Tax=Lupinus angustifolius TaxID=3871 RepID=UPI00092F74B0|nr:PREDICTED: beta-glucosidase 40-like [Lupinus angustifolius]